MEPIAEGNIWTQVQSTPSQKQKHILHNIRAKQIKEQPKSIKRWYKANSVWLKKKNKPKPNLNQSQKTVMFRVNAETKAKKAREKQVSRGVREFLKNEERAKKWEQEFAAIVD
jgi:hypothetical protein